MGIPVGARRRPRAVWRLAKCGGTRKQSPSRGHDHEREGGRERPRRARTGDDKAGG